MPCSPLKIGGIVNITDSSSEMTRDSSRNVRWLRSDVNCVFHQDISKVKKRYQIEKHKFVSASIKTITHESDHLIYLKLIGFSILDESRYEFGCVKDEMDIFIVEPMHDE